MTLIADGAVLIALPNPDHCVPSHLAMFVAATEPAWEKHPPAKSSLPLAANGSKGRNGGDAGTSSCPIRTLPSCDVTHTDAAGFRESSAHKHVRAECGNRKNVAVHPASQSGPICPVPLGDVADRHIPGG